jgi:hypothetical protein
MLAQKALDARLLLLPQRGVPLELATAKDEVDFGEGNDTGLVDELVAEVGDDVDGDEEVVLR